MLDLVRELLHVGDEAGRAQAEPKRRTDIAHIGHTIPEIRAHLENRMGERFPANGISTSTIRRLLAPPTSNTDSAKYYKHLFPCKPPPKKNNLRLSNEDGHFANAESLTNGEFFERHSQLSLSLDNMNKIKVGALAVSRYHQIGRMYLAEHAPNYEDHDFPTPGYSIVCSGVQVLTGHAAAPKGQATEEWAGIDRWDRPRQPVQTCGQLHTFLRAPIFHPTTIATHLLNVWNVLLGCFLAGQPEPLGLLINVDGGPDLTPDSDVNLVMWGRLWLSSGCLVFIVSTHAAGLSALNSIEHAWSPLSKSLTSKQFPSTLEDEDVPPVAQKRLLHLERRAKEAKIFDAAMEAIAEIFRKVDYSGSKVTAKVIPCLENDDEAPVSAPEDSRLGAPPIVSDYGLVHTCMNGGVREVRDTPVLQEIRKEFLWFLKHVSKRRYGLVFVSCQDPACKCPGNTTDWESPFMKELVKLGGTLPSPTPSEKDKSHYMTLKEHLELDPFKVRAAADQHCPSRISKGLGWCPECLSYVHTSKANEDHHKSKVHGKESCGPPHYEKSLPTFRCNECDASLPNKWAANGHAMKEKHTVSSKTPAAKKLNHRVKRGRFTAPEQRQRGASGPLPEGNPPVPPPPPQRPQRPPPQRRRPARRPRRAAQEQPGSAQEQQQLERRSRRDRALAQQSPPEGERRLGSRVKRRVRNRAIMSETAIKREAARKRRVKRNTARKRATKSKMGKVTMMRTVATATFCCVF